MTTDSTGYVEATFATYGSIDHHGDVHRKGCFQEGQPVLIGAYGHKSNADITGLSEMPVGRGRIVSVGNEVRLQGYIDLTTKAGRDTFQGIKTAGDLQEWSYSLADTERSPGMVNGQRINYIDKVRALEVCPVLRGAGRPQTRTISVKSEREYLADLHKQYTANPYLLEYGKFVRSELDAA